MSGAGQWLEVSRRDFLALGDLTFQYPPNTEALVKEARSRVASNFWQESSCM